VFAMVNVQILLQTQVIVALVKALILYAKQENFVMEVHVKVIHVELAKHFVLMIRK